MNTNTESTIPRYPQSEPLVRNYLVSTQAPLCNCYTPAQIKTAYGISSEFTGRNKKIAVIEAFSHPNLQSDFNRFSEEFSLPQSEISIISLNENPSYDLSWAIEAATDVQWCHALAPDAEIIAVFAKSSSYSDLFDAVATAISNGANIVSMSFGTEEFRTQTQYARIFDNDNVIFTAASGDVGGSVFFPSSSPYVISVGATTLPLSPKGQRTGTESAWKDSGGGPSLYIRIPEYQRVFENINSLSEGFRATPDIAFVGNPDTGVAVYFTDNSGEGSFRRVGGTSVSAPCIAGIAALSTNTNELPDYLYSLAGSPYYNIPQYEFNDITVGNNTRYNALIGYDLCTGLGTPRKVFGS